MDLRQLKYFMAIAEEGQISRAARRLHMAQPPLSLQLKLLEESLGVLLVERNTKRLRLTGAGVALYQRAEQILGLVDATARDMRDFDAGLRGTLAIGSPPGIGHLVLPQRMADFHAKYPDVHFHWREGNSYRVLELLNTRVVELGVVRLPVDAGLYETLPLLTEPWVGVVQKLPGQVQADSIALKELAAMPLMMMHRQQGIFCHDMVWEELHAAKVTPRVLCESDNVTALLILVELGMGAAIVPRSTLSLKAGAALHVMDIAGCALQSSVALTWLRGARLSPAAERFLAMFQAPHTTAGQAHLPAQPAV
jgi:DNA-binding transcriptional LysR family regulator